MLPPFHSLRGCARPPLFAPLALGIINTYNLSEHLKGLDRERMNLSVFISICSKKVFCQENFLPKGSPASQEIWGRLRLWEISRVISKDSDSDSPRTRKSDSPHPSEPVARHSRRLETPTVRILSDM